MGELSSSEERSTSMTTFGMRGFLRSGASSGTSREAGARDSCALRGVAGLMTGRRGRVLCCSASCNSRASFSSAALLSCSAALASSSSFINSSMSARSASLDGIAVSNAPKARLDDRERSPELRPELCGREVSAQAAERVVERGTQGPILFQS